MSQEQEIQKTTTVVLDEKEKNVLLQLIDIAVKAGGLNVAEAALHLVKKISAD